MTDSIHTHPKTWLIALASAREFQAAAAALGIGNQTPRPWQLMYTDCAGFDLVWTGVGKANAAGAVARVLDTDRHVGVLSAGIAGALLSDSGNQTCSLLDVVCAHESVFADEGVQTPVGFESCSAMGFAPFEDGTDSVVHATEAIELISRFADVAGKVATVSVCSGTNSGARAVVSRTGAIAEAMEGAAIALAAKRISPDLLTGEIRVISNTTGDREMQQWDLDGAMEKLSNAIGRIARGA